MLPVQRCSVHRVATRSLRLPRCRRGAISLLVLGSILIIAVVMAGAFMVGRTALTRQQMQAASDSMARAAALTAQRRGVVAARNPGSFQQVIPGNSLPGLAGPVVLGAQTAPGGDFLNITVNMSSVVSSDNVGLTGVAQLPVVASSLVQVRQVVYDDVTRDIPGFVLALDYSGSMSSSFGGGRTRIQALKSSVISVLDLDLGFDYGLVIFSSGIKDSVGVSENSVPGVRSAVNSHDAGGGTHTDTAVSRAGDMLRVLANDKPRNILLVSDGYPNSGHDPTGVARGLRMNHDISIYTLEIKTQGAGMEQVMRRVAGPAGDPDGNDAGYYYSASNENALRDAFREIAAKMLCQVDAPDPPPQMDENGDPIAFGFLKPQGNGEERSIDLKYNAGNPPKFAIENMEDCDQILDGTHTLVLRYDRPVLIR